MKPNVLILHATGTNRDLDAAQAVELAGGNPEIVHLNQMRWGERHWKDYQMLVLPGGFSYADALGAGRLLALDLKVYFAEQVRAFVEAGKPVIGICNGFQALVKSGILPDLRVQGELPLATLTHNASGRFECRWVTLQPASRKCIWTGALTEPVYCPVAHGEGRFLTSNQDVLNRLHLHDQVALVYALADGSNANGVYPYNPNGSVDDIAGICNPEGNVLGLMPHPENHIFLYQHPRWQRGERQYGGLPLFTNGILYAARL